MRSTRNENETGNKAGMRMETLGKRLEDYGVCVLEHVAKVQEFITS